MIVVVDYGIGNLRSVQKALERVGATAVVSADPGSLDAAQGIVLPGVGAFGDGMANLQARGLVKPLLRQAEAGKPLLGICLGMQLLFDESKEMGRHRGLGLLPGRVVRFPGVGFRLVVGMVEPGAVLIAPITPWRVARSRSILSSSTVFSSGSTSLILSPSSRSNSIAVLLSMHSRALRR